MQMVRPTFIAALPLKDLLQKIEEEFKDMIDRFSVTFVGGELSKLSDRFNIDIVTRLYKGELIYIPLEEKEEKSILNFQIYEEETPTGYVQLESGLVISEMVARDAKMDYKRFEFPEPFFLN